MRLISKEKEGGIERTGVEERVIKNSGRERGEKTHRRLWTDSYVS